MKSIERNCFEFLCFEVSFCRSIGQKELFRLSIYFGAISIGRILAVQENGGRGAHAANKDDGKNIHTVYAGHHHHPLYSSEIHYQDGSNYCFVAASLSKKEKNGDSISEVK